MLIATLLCIVQTGPPAVEPATYSGRQAQLQVALPRLDAQIDVDGVLDEPVWQQAARLTDFSAYAPLDGEPAEVLTEVLVFYSPTALHFGVRAHAPVASVRATLANRDRLDTEDQLRFFLSTFNDGRQALYFAVNPLGVQADGVLVEGQGVARSSFFGALAGGREDPDLAPDYVFDSKGRLTPEGYQVELRIPFKSLRFPGGREQSWGLHVTRMLQSSGHEHSWAPARRSATSFLAQAGTLLGLRELQRGLVLDLTPELTAHLDGAPSTAPAHGFRYDAARPGLGGNLRWGLTPNLTLNGTLNPDFSQVEADAGQFTFDPRSALFFSEKRPFFLEGTEQFATPNRLIYTRRIVDPLAAVKLSGKQGRTSLAFLSAVDSRDSSHDGEQHPWFNLLRVQRDLGGGQSTVALVYTDRRDGTDQNSVAASDARFAFGELWSLRLQGALSHSKRAGRSFSGPLWEALLNRNGRKFGLRLQATGVGEEFRAESGFISRGGIAHVNLDPRLTLFGGPKSHLESLSSDMVLDGIWRHSEFLQGGGTLERKLHWNNNLTLRGGWKLGGSLLVERFDFDRELYADYAIQGQDGQPQPFVAVPFIRNLDWVLTLRTPQFSGFSANGSWLWGRDENFFEWSPADIQYVDLNVDYRPTEQLRFEARYQLQRFDRRSDSSNVGVRHIPRLKLEYQLNRAVFFRVVGEYDIARQDDLRDDGRSELPLLIRDSVSGLYQPALGFSRKRLRLDLLFSYQPTPGTVIFAGYGSRLLEDGRPGAGLRREGDGFFLKLSYLFRM